MAKKMVKQFAKILVTTINGQKIGKTIRQNFGDQWPKNW